MQFFIVVDPQGLSQAFPNFQEAKEKFENLVSACKQVQKDNPTFKCKFETYKEDGNYLKQFRARYKNPNNYWVNEIYVMQQITL